MVFLFPSGENNQILHVYNIIHFYKHSLMKRLSYRSIDHLSHVRTAISSAVFHFQCLGPLIDNISHLSLFLSFWTCTQQNKAGSEMLTFREDTEKITTLGCTRNLCESL